MSILYKFLVPERAVNLIAETYFENELLRITQPGDLNDLFECLPSYYDTRVFKNFCREMKRAKMNQLMLRGISKLEMDSKMLAYDVWQKIEIEKFLSYNPDNAFTEVYESAREEINSKIGIISLSRIWNNVLMWSHYTKSHSGVCIGFDSQDKFFNDFRKENLQVFLTPVIYGRNRIQMPERDSIIPGEFLYSKSHDWRYEKEERLIVSLSQSAKTEKGDKFPIHLFKIPHDLISEVILGANSSPEIYSKMKEFTKNAKIKLYKAEISRYSYKVERRLI